MHMSELDDDRRYLVVLNDEEQYSVWPTERDVPAGWRAEGFEGTRQECLDHVSLVWTDMRPLSLRRAMETARD
ncbi:MbtH family protein [Streptomyces viridifaciens]|uniref:MbtH protein n=2 Tax=Kitasatospora aureofaciens TaxID=1894 RepID=A0A8H9HHS3_KITAU|nr:MbtH family protein [Streptomyces viridifaciens]GGU56719.1 MbtH protein [Kitasatospora aureofaciens]HJD82032.1 MbtH family protein [Kitasatospora aureofaciens]